MNKLHHEFLYYHRKIPVMASISELQEFLLNNPDHYFCFYLADKNNIAWDKSTSRVYFNQIWPEFLYIPIQIDLSDQEFLKQVYLLAKHTDSVIAINQTNPYKNNDILNEWFPYRTEKYIDSLVKNQHNEFEIKSINSKAFQHWFEMTFSKLTQWNICIIGNGQIASSLKDLLKSLNISNLTLNRFSEQDSFLIINAASKEGETNLSSLYTFLKTQKHSSKHIYIDLLPYSSTKSFEIAKKFDWNAYTGASITMHNNYFLLQAIADKVNFDIPSFKEFEQIAIHAI